MGIIIGKQQCRTEKIKRAKRNYLLKTMLFRADLRGRVAFTKPICNWNKVSTIPRAWQSTGDGVVEDLNNALRVTICNEPQR